MQVLKAPEDHKFNRKERAAGLELQQWHRTTGPETGVKDIHGGMVQLLLITKQYNQNWAILLETIIENLGLH